MLAVRELLIDRLTGYLHAVSGLRTSVLSAAVPADLAMPFPAGKARRNWRSRRLLETTNTELNAIAAPHRGLVTQTVVVSSGEIQEPGKEPN